MKEKPAPKEIPPEEPPPKTIWERLAEPTPESEIKWRQGNRMHGGDCNKVAGNCTLPHRNLAYVDARYVMDRLDEVCGPENWQCRYDWSDGKRLVCTIGIREIAGAMEWIWKANGAGETDIEGEKGAFSDAFKRAAVLFGIARDLYRLQPPKTATPVRDAHAALTGAAPFAGPPPTPPPVQRAPMPPAEQVPSIVTSMIAQAVAKTGKSGAPYYSITLTDGRVMSTFDKRQFDICANASELDIACKVRFIQKGNYLNIVSVEPVAS